MYKLFYINDSLTSGLRSPEMLRGVGWWLVTDVSGQPNGPIFRGQAILEEDCLTIDDEGCPETSATKFNLLLATSQKSEGFSYTAAEA
jgi:hypothetical protein